MWRVIIEATTEAYKLVPFIPPYNRHFQITNIFGLTCDLSFCVWWLKSCCLKEHPEATLKYNTPRKYGNQMIEFLFNSCLPCLFTTEVPTKYWHTIYIMTRNCVLLSADLCLWSRIRTRIWLDVSTLPSDNI